MPLENFIQVKFMAGNVVSCVNGTTDVHDGGVTFVFDDDVVVYLAQDFVWLSCLFLCSTTDDYRADDGPAA